MTPVTVAAGRIRAERDDTIFAMREDGFTWRQILRRFQLNKGTLQKIWRAHQGKMLT